MCTILCRYLLWFASVRCPFRLNERNGKKSFVSMSFYYYFSFLRVLSIRQNILIQANESNRFHLFLLILFLLLFYFLMYARAIRKNLISSSPNNTKLRGAFTTKSQKHKTKIVFYGTEMDERASSAINYFLCVSVAYT